MDFGQTAGRSIEMAKRQGEVDVNPTLTQELDRRKERLERELAGVTEALTALRANPDVERVLNLIQKVR